MKKLLLVMLLVSGVVFANITKKQNINSCIVSCRTQFMLESMTHKKAWRKFVPCYNSLDVTCYEKISNKILRGKCKKRCQKF
ncbi:MAG: hypothetical protein ACTSXL_00775 [Alphaproteobacteria bacterium]